MNDRETSFVLTATSGIEQVLTVLGMNSPYGRTHSPSYIEELREVYRILMTLLNESRRNATHSNFFQNIPKKKQKVKKKNKKKVNPKEDSKIRIKRILE